MMPTRQDLQVIDAYHRLHSPVKVALELGLTVGQVQHRYLKTLRWFEEMFGVHKT